MDPFWLTFRSPALEAQYERYRFQATFRKMDIYGTAVAVAMRASCVLRFGRASWTTHAHFAWVALDLVCRAWMPVDRLWMYRTRLAVCSRVAYILEILFGSRYLVTMFLGYDASASPVFMAMSLLTVLGVFTITLSALGQPVKFMHHFPLQVLMSSLILLFLSTVSCQQISTHVAARPMIEWFALKLDYLARAIVNAVCILDRKATLAWNMQLPCLQLALFSQLFFGTGILSYMVWIMERRSRVEFIAALPQVERQRLTVHRLPTVISLMHFFLFFVMFAVSWRVFFDISPQIQRFGKVLGY